jgi:competence protein ComEA
MSVTRIVLVVVALVAGVAAVVALFQAWDERSAPPIVIEDVTATRPVVVDVRGAVQTPGVYELPPGARVQDAVAAAQGLSKLADLSTVNLARRLRDGEVVVIGDLPAPGSTPQSVEAVDEVSGPRININMASADALDALPGVGEVTANRIISYRETNGPFRSVDDLVLIQGISDRTIDGFRDMVTVGP